ncbi:hypothetical protein [Embleya sp. NPDC005575]|uniref:hypothetical protein n=1 Tax=Embleya sp. NPDC005575 TaxID=3156892 RepID=UPI0033B8AC82
MGRTATVGGRTVTLPNTLAEIRAALPEERRAEFDKTIGETPLDELPRVAVLHYALPDEARAEDDALMDRIQAGDFSGLVNADGTPFVP